jgi:hypothetical protein
MLQYNKTKAPTITHHSFNCIARENTYIIDLYLDVQSGEQHYGAIDYSGTWFVNTDKGDNYIGCVFGYVNNRKFYTVIWRRDNLNYGGQAHRIGVRGLQLKVYIHDHDS